MEYKQCIYVRQSISGSTSASRTVHSGLFPGSRRLFEVADSLTEIKTVCACGHKATVNARIAGGRIVTEGEQVFLGGNESYVAMCYKCWQEKIKKQREEDNNR